MHSIKDVVGRIETKLQYRAPFVDPNAVPDEVDKEVINYIFKEIKVICTSYRCAWSNRDEYIDAKRSWYKAFQIAGLNSMSLIERGLDKLRVRCGKEASFVPTSGQFIEMCKITAQELGIPSLEEAYREAATQGHRSWSHPIVYHAYQNSGAYEMKTLPPSQNFPIFERNYQILLRKILNGENLPSIPKAIEYQMDEKPFKPNPEWAAQHLDSLKKMLNQ